SFLWSQRDAAVTDPHYDLQDLSRLDDRVEAHIDGLRVAGDHGWARCEEGMETDDPGSVFTGSVIAFESGDGQRIEKVVKVGSESRAAFRGMVSGLGWLNDHQFNSVIGQLVRANSGMYRRLGIAACGIRRMDPKTYLESAIQDSDLFLKSRALRAVGELKRQDLMPLLKTDLRNEDHSCRFEAARSALLLGDHSALRSMGQFVQAPSSFRLPAMQIAFRAMDTQTSQNWLKALSKDSGNRRDVIIGMGIIGDPVYIPSLLKQMETTELARVAGEAFSMITGVDLADEDLEGEWPEGFEAGPNDDLEDESVEMDEDEDLPWPDVALISQWWQQNQGDFSVGTRYLGGQPISPLQCKDVLKTGFQRQRNAAALELALSQADAPYFNTKAPGKWQQARLQ
ncbi:MAG: TIGR02270 family protein, partial [Xanthomonadales bacterium]|nr:TIGR02270 family protein [Xanthomonadales bacterium]